MKSVVVASVIAGCAAASFTPISASTEERLESSFSDLKKELVDENSFCPPSLSFDVNFLVDGTAEAAELGERWNDSIIPNLNKWMQREFPGSRFAVSWFRDKPMKPVGDGYDTCFSMATDFTDSEATLLAVAQARSFFGGTAPGWGDEMYNAQGQAILSASQYSGLSWRESVLARPPGDSSRGNVIKQIVLITYTKSHSLSDRPYPPLPYMNENTLNASGDPDYLCRTQYYPDTEEAFLSSTNNFTNIVAWVPYNRPEVIKHWQEIASNVENYSEAGKFKVGLLVEDWESNLLDLFMMLINSVNETCGSDIPTEFPTSTAASNTTRTGPTTATTAEPTTTTTKTTGPTTATTGEPTTTTTKTTGPTTAATAGPTTTTTKTTGPTTATTGEPTTPTTKTTGPTTATTGEMQPTPETSSIAVHNCTGHGCCDAIEFKAKGRIEDVHMQFKWAQRVRRLLSSIAW